MHYDTAPLSFTHCHYHLNVYQYRCPDFPKSNWMIRQHILYFRIKERYSSKMMWWDIVSKMFTLSLKLPLLSLSIMSKRALISSSWAPSALPGPFLTLADQYELIVISDHHFSMGFSSWALSLVCSINMNYKTSINIFVPPLGPLALSPSTMPVF